ncbi:ABC transporter ATP-binding protein [Burkholderiaceae bacterium FT117]|uniref:ABC transporter ATP-binding protein n=1 Tax=Zeimonas sediminis TaxID=2944268 RepID=UPI0023431275|nr:ABC transporter ATP-binding protein [Zeimonas sediminis]MCM5570980.1 ABC transporter ATP-binding protein [Zeimonas sediminis]
MTRILEVEGLTKRFGGLTAVSNVSFAVNAGDVVGILGPNGAGKTTLYNLLTGFIPPDEGRVAFMGREIRGVAPHRIVRLGISRTFQLCRPFVGMTVLENVKVGSLAQPAPPQGRDARARELIEQVGLGGKEGMPVEVMSYGDQRRLEIARALATGPKLLLLDEPFAGLGAGEIADLSALIRKIHAETGLTVLLIEHKLHEFMKLVDRVIALDFGEMIADDVPERIVTHPRVIEAYIGGNAPDTEAA